MTIFNDHTYLYVEDDTLSREALDIIMRRVIKIERLYVFADSVNFLERVRALSPSPDIILLDIHVPPHNGFEMLKMLREDEGFKDARIVALTASVMNEEVTLLRERGFDSIIAKPINVSSFPKLLERLVQGESVWHVDD